MDRRVIRWSRGATARCSSAPGMPIGALCFRKAPAIYRIFAKSPCRPRPSLKREAPATPSSIKASRPLYHSRISASRTVNPWLLIAERRSARTQTCGKRAISCASSSAFARAPPLGSYIFAQANVETFFSRHFSSGQNNFQRATLADDTRQTHRSAVDQWHAPATTIDTEVELLAITRKSHHNPSSIPPATAGPSIAAMTGLSNSRREGPNGPRGMSPPLP